MAVYKPKVLRGNLEWLKNKHPVKGKKYLCRKIRTHDTV